MPIGINWVPINGIVEILIVGDFRMNCIKKYVKIAHRLLIALIFISCAVNASSISSRTTGLFRSLANRFRLGSVSQPAYLRTLSAATPNTNLYNYNSAQPQKFSTSASPQSSSWTSWFRDLFTWNKKERPVLIGSEVPKITLQQPSVDISTLSKQPQVEKDLSGQMIASDQSISNAMAGLMLVEAIKNGSAEDLKNLIRKGLIDINARYQYGDTILHIAEESKVSPDIISLLIEVGADVNAQNNLKKTPLHRAADVKYVKGVQQLLVHGANPNILNTYRKTALAEAQEFYYGTEAGKEIIKLLEPVTDKSLWFKITPDVALERAVKSGDLKAIDDLVRERKDLIHHRYLKNMYNETILHKASKEVRNAAVIERLIQVGADINAKARNDETPLHKAADYGNIDAVRVLLAHGADPNSVDTAGKTPLDLAESTNYSTTKKIVEMLKAVTAQSKSQSTAQQEDSFTESSESQQSKQQSSQSRSLKDDLTAAVRQRNKERVQEILKIRTFDKKILSGLLYDAVNDLFPNYDIVTLLVDAGADVNTKDNWRKETPLHRAVAYKDLKMVQLLLLKKDANPNIVNEDGESPLYTLQEDDAPPTDKVRKIMELLEPFTQKSLWFVLTPEIALRRAIKFGNLDDIRRLMGMSEQEFAKEGYSIDQAVKTAENETQQESQFKSAQTEPISLQEAWNKVVAKSPLYEILGTKENASAKDINAAYLHFIRTHHPDFYASNPEQSKIANEVIKYIHSKLR